MTNLPNGFTVWDYGVFLASLVASMGIGIYFATKGDKQRTQSEYLMGGRSMPVIPVAISLLVSFMSAILMIGVPAELYNQGTEWYTGGLGIGLGFLLAGVFFVPLLYPLGLTSAFEYLEKRFHSHSVRLLGMTMMIISQIMYMGVASFAPATAFQAATGFPVWVTILIAGLVTTFYTTIGGMKAVVWTDVFQATLMLAGILSILIQGLLKAGGPERVWNINKEWDRVHFFTNTIDPRVRHTAYSCIIGNSLGWMAQAGCGQASVQRFCSLPTLRQAQTAVLMNVAIVLVLYFLVCSSGVVMFAYYAAKDCNLLREDLNLVDDPNHLIPYFVMDILAYPPIPGLFFASLFSGALSSMSSSMNSMAAIVWEDALKPYVGDRLSENQKTLVLKIMVGIFGCLSIGVSYATMFLDGTVVQTAIALISPPNGAIAGLFLLGALFPCANKYGAFTGALIGLGLASWQVVGSMYTGIKNFYLELDTPNGTCGVNASDIGFTPATVSPILATNKTLVKDSNALDYYYSVSYLWVTAIAILGCVIPGLLISLLTRCFVSEEERHVPPALQMPIFSRICCCLPESWLYCLNCCRAFEPLKQTAEQSEEKKHLPQTDYIDAYEESPVLTEPSDKKTSYNFNQENPNFEMEDSRYIRMTRISSLFEKDQVNRK